MIELRDRDRARAWLVAGLDSVRVGAPGIEQLAGEAPNLLAVLSEAGSLAPAGAVIDVGRLLRGQAPRADDTAAAPPLLRAPLRAYRDQLLARIEASAELDRLTDACAGLPTAALRRRAIAVVITRLLSRLGFDGGVGVAPGLIRELAGGDTGAPPGPSELELLAGGYRELAARARRVGRLLEPADTFVVERIEALGDLAQRLAIAEIGEVEQAVTAGLPARIVARRRDRDRAQAARMTEEESYPTGGFSAISTTGSLDNLVSSELIYMDPGRGGDLFDLRWAEGELLYYTRDDSLFFRGRREIVFALLPDCAGARVKDLGAGHQRLIAALGLMVAVLDRLEAWLDAPALTVRWIFVGSEPAPLAPERSLAEILLGPWSARGVAAVDTALALPAQVEASAATETAAVVVTTDVDSPLIEADVSGRLCIGTPRPTLTWRPGASGARAPTAGDIADSWLWCASELLAELL